ncbi:MAG TPA: ABC transporter permease [Patescibacteria group bacterium]|nr:ABC transporter permease [Patescibacteria group bacterium]
MTAASQPVAGRAPSASRLRRRGSSRGLRGYYWLMLFLLYLPIVLLFIFSFNANTILSFPLKGFTLEWFQKLFESPNLLGAVGRSVIVAVVASAVATVLGTMVALLLSRFEFRGKGLLTSLAILPLLVPFFVLAVALLILFRVLGVPLGLPTIAIGHAVIALPYTTLIVLARLLGFDRQLEEASMDLGATYPSTLRLVLIPIAAPAIASAFITAFTVSFDEFALALFLAGKDPTFPVYLYGQLRFATTLPVLIAAAVLLMAGSLGLILVADRIRRR